MYNIEKRLDVRTRVWGCMKSRKTSSQKNLTQAIWISSLNILLSIFFFHAESMDELSLKAGDLIMLKSRVGSDWLRGRTINGKEGIFPKSFVEVVVS